MGAIVRGCDAASAIQGLLPVKAMRADGLDFCILRGKVGNNPGRDKLFLDNIYALRDAGFIYSIYNFPFPLRNIDPVSQAAGFTEAAMVDGHPIGSAPGEGPPAYDLEWPPPEQWTSRNLSADFIVDYAFIQLELIERDTGCAPIIYSYPWFIASLAKAKNFASLLKYRLWIAGGPNYINGNGNFPTIFSPPSVPGWGTSAVLWQFDGNGGRKLPNGVDADFNVFNGSIDDLKRLCKTEDPAPTMPSPPSLDIIAQQASSILVDDGVQAYRQARVDALLAAV